MIRRLFWIGTGVVLGLWGRRKVVQTVDNYVPKVVVDKATTGVKGLLSQLATAQHEARKAILGKRSDSN